MIGVKDPRTRGRVTATLHRSLILVGVAAWAVLPILGLIWITNANSHATLAAPTVAWVPVSDEASEVRIDVDLALLWETGNSLLAPAWNGTVQSVNLTRGQSVTSGDIVAVIDGISRIAWHSNGVFYRPLTPGDRGSDVTWLKQILSAEGMPQNASEVFDWRALNDVRKFAGTLGVPNSGRISSFDPSWLVYMPSDPFVVESIDLQKAAPAPSPGTAIAVGKPRLVGAALLDEGTLITGGASTKASSDELNEAEFDSLVQRAGVTAEEGQRLWYSGQELALDPSRQQLASDSIEVLRSGVMENPPALPAQLIRTLGTQEYLIPTSAISSSPRAKICIRDELGTREIDVEIVAGTNGGTVITGPLQLGDDIRVPGPSGEAKCRSSSAT